MRRRILKMSIYLALAVLCMGAGAYAVFHQAKFGRHPEGARLTRVEASPDYKDGEFRNTVPTPMLAEGQSSIKIMLGSLFSGPERLRPEERLPTVKHDLRSLDPDIDTLVWLGHSSYFILAGGKRILVDPVFSGYGAPFSMFNKIFPGTDFYSAADMPEIDYLLISHDHWDHLDYRTVTALMPKTGKAVMPLGVGAHFEHWGYPQDKIVEAEWNDVLRLSDALTIHVVPARHYSGRGFTRNKTLWAGFVLESGGVRIFLSGDTGYGPHIGELARKFGGFDLAAIDGGQYDPRWPLIHMTPEEAVASAEELGAKAMMLAHAGRFAIAAHSWDEPFIRAERAVKGKAFPLLTPKIGEPVCLDGREQVFTHWWEGRK